MLKIQVTTAEAVIQETELITAGRRGLECAFSFDSAWADLAKTVVVQGVVKRDIQLVGNSIVVPGECIAKENYPLKIGVYGANGDGDIAIPTVWASFGKILPSATRSDIPPDELTPDLVSQIEQNSANAIYLAQRVSQQAANGEFNGANGLDGNDGYSPTIDIESITGGHRVTTHDIAQVQSFDVMDGVDGTDGEGVPPAGTTAQYLRKASGTDYDTEWATMPEEVFWAVRGTTTSAQIEAAYQAGKVVCCAYNKRVYRLSNRESATDHYFTCIGGNSSYSLRCNNDSWGTATVFNLALSASVPSAATSAPADLGTAAVGSSAKYAKADHVHNMPSASDVGAIADPGSGTTGQVLKKTADGVEWANESGGGGTTEVFWATYGTTTTADMKAAKAAGKIVLVSVTENSKNYVLELSAILDDDTCEFGGSYSGTVLGLSVDYPGLWGSLSTRDVPVAQNSGTPAALGTAARGTATTYSRSDHVHDYPTDLKNALLQLAAKVAYIDGNGQQYYDDLEAALTHRTLSSISAVYTQSGTVLWSDSLDSLKSDLVVTAHYLDNTSATVTAYTLSGTLTLKSTSTITVTYKGETTTFNVTVSDIVYQLTADDFDLGGLSYSYNHVVGSNHYIDPNTKTRLSHAPFDLVIDGGHTYELTLVSTESTAQIAGGWVTQDGMTIVSSQSNLSATYVYDPGWSSGLVYTVAIPATHNSSPIVRYRPSVRKSSSNPTITSGFVVSFTIRLVS